MKKLLPSLFLICCFLNSYAQDLNTIDSLKKLLTIAKPDSNKVLLLLHIGEQYERIDPETSKQYYRQSLQLSRKISYKQGEIKFASYYTAVLNMQGKFDSSLILNKNALKLAKQLKDELYIAKATFNTANSYHLMAKEDSALYNYMQVLPILERIGNKRMLGMAYSNIQNIYADLSQYQKAIFYGKKGLHIFEKEINDPLNHSYCASNLGIVYHQLKKLDTAEMYFNQALKICRSIGDQYSESAVLLNLADIHYKNGQLEASKANFEKAYAIANKMELMETKAIALKGMGMYYLEKKNYSMAKQFADSALNVALSNNLRKEVLKLYGLLADISYAKQDLKSAHEFEEKEDALSDSISADNLQKITTEFETKYKTQQKTDQIALQRVQLKQKSTLNYLLAAATIGFLVISILIYRNYQHRQKLQKAKIDELETEKQLTATEAVLKGEEQERTRLAKDLHDGLGGMLSGIKFSLNNMRENLIMTPENVHAFERSIDMLDSSIKEMRRVAHNMMPEILVKYGLDAALREYCDEMDRSGVLHINYQSVGMQQAELAQTTSVTVYRIVQELLNNTIKHANAKNVLVQLHQSAPEKLLAVTVEDDGKGFDANLLKQADGMGWANIKNRVEFLKGKIDLQSSPGKGTSVMIEINI